MKSVKLIFAVFVGIYLLAASASLTMAGSGMANMGTVTIFKQGPVTIHSYLAPVEGSLVTSHVIETEHKLVVIDAQFARLYAKELRNYINRLNKPIDRIIISHNHPDHWFGLEYFTEIPIYSLKETRDLIEQKGDMYIEGMKGDRTTSRKVVPDKIINEGKEVIDGVEYEFEKVMTAEAPVQLLIRLPGLNTLIAQDLVFNNVHLVISGKDEIDGWIQAIKRLQALLGFDTILGGHGEPTSPAVYPKVLQYLDDAKAILASSKTADEYKKKILEKYASHRVPFYVDLSISMLFKKPE